MTGIPSLVTNYSTEQDDRISETRQTTLTISTSSFVKEKIIRIPMCCLLPKLPLL